MGRLAGKVAIVTGGASGIGRGAVEVFVREGATVVIADVQDEKGEALAKEVGASYRHVDVAEEAQVADLVAGAVAAHGRLDCMFNNAGVVGPRASILDVPFEEAEVAFRILFWGVAFGVKHAGRVMKAQGY